MPESFERGALTETTLLVLLSLYEKRHGYGVIKYVSQLTDGRVEIPVGTLYASLSSVEAKGLIEEVETSEAYRTRKKEYIITPKGKRAVLEELERMCSLVKIGKETILSEREKKEKLPDEVIEEHILNFNP